MLEQSLTLTDDPTLKSFRGRPLFGHYYFDDEGVPARRVVLIERGLLRGLLLSRYPVKGFPRSNGHAARRWGRSRRPARPARMFLTNSSDPSPSRSFSRACATNAVQPGQKPTTACGSATWRAAVQQQGGGGQGSIRFAARVDLVEAATGKLTRVRDLDLVGTPLVMAESVTAAGDDPDASDIYLVAPTSVIAPSLLLAEAELQRSETKPEKGPILPPPQPFAPEPGEHRRRRRRRRAFTRKERSSRSTGTCLRQSWTRRFLDASRRSSTTLQTSSAWRQTRTPDGIVIDVKIVGGDPAAAAAAVRRAATAVESIAQGGVHKTTLAATSARRRIARATRTAGPGRRPALAARGPRRDVRP